MYLKKSGNSQPAVNKPVDGAMNIQVLAHPLQGQSLDSLRVVVFENSLLQPEDNRGMIPVF